MVAECPCGCHGICSCELGEVVGSWCCRKHEDAHCKECRTAPG